MNAKIEQARFNMIEQQIKPWNVHDRAVLEAMRQIRREDFVPTEHAALAFADLSIPLSSGAAMLEPKIVAKMLQALAIKANDRVLLVGVATGYVAALVSRLSDEVICVAADDEALATAKRNLAMAGISNVRFEQGDALSGWRRSGDIDCVFIRGAISAMPRALCEQLSEDGRCVAVIGSGQIMELVSYQKLGGVIQTQSILDTVIPTLSKHQPKAKFIF